MQDITNVHKKFLEKGDGDLKSDKANRWQCWQLSKSSVLASSRKKLPVTVRSLGDSSSALLPPVLTSRTGARRAIKWIEWVGWETIWKSGDCDELKSECSIWTGQLFSTLASLTCGTGAQYCYIFWLFKRSQIPRNLCEISWTVIVDNRFTIKKQEEFTSQFKYICRLNTTTLGLLSCKLRVWEQRQEPKIKSRYQF